jgi:hypothetical protein
MKIQKILWISFLLLILGIIILILTRVQYQTSVKNRFEIDLDEYYNEDMLLNDPNDIDVNDLIYDS